jgi:hypothetical protein
METTNRISQRQTGLKQQIGALGLGILVLAAVFGFVALVSNDARVAYIIGAVLIFCTALWVGPKSPRPWQTAASLCGPLVIAFGLLALTQLPVLWPNLLLWLIAAYLVLIVAFGLLAVPAFRRLATATSATEGHDRRR